MFFFPSGGFSENVFIMRFDRVPLGPNLRFSDL